MKSRNPSLLSNSGPPRRAAALPKRPNCIGLGFLLAMSPPPETTPSSAMFQRGLSPNDVADTPSAQTHSKDSLGDGGPMLTSKIPSHRRRPVPMAEMGPGLRGCNPIPVKIEIGWPSLGVVWLLLYNSISGGKGIAMSQGVRVI